MEELSTGVLVPFHNVFAISNLIDLRVREVSKQIQAFKEANPIEWNHFCYKVHSGAARHPLDSLAPRRKIMYLGNEMEVYKIGPETQVEGHSNV